MQVLQEIDNFKRTVNLCQVEKITFIYHCGMNKHASGPQFKHWGAVEITEHECRDMHNRRIYVAEGDQRHVQALEVDN